MYNLSHCSPSFVRSRRCCMFLLHCTYISARYRCSCTKLSLPDDNRNCHSLNLIAEYRRMLTIDEINDNCFTKGTCTRHDKPHPSAGLGRLLGQHHKLRSANLLILQTVQARGNAGEASREYLSAVWLECAGPSATADWRRYAMITHLNVAFNKQFGQVREQACAHDMISRHDEKASCKVHLLVRITSLGEPRRRDDNKIALGCRQGVPDGQGLRKGDGIVYEVEKSTPEPRCFCLELLCR